MDQELLASEENNTGPNSSHNLVTKETEKDSSSPNDVDSSSFSREQHMTKRWMWKLDAWQRMASVKIKWQLTLHAIIRNVEHF